MIDDRCVQREYTLDADAKADLTDSYSFADAAMLAGDTDALESLKTLFVAFFNTDVYAKRVARLKCRNIFFNLCVLNTI